MAASSAETAPSLPYHEPDIITILVLTSFLLLLNVINSIFDKFLYCGLLGQIAVGIAWGTPGAKILSSNIEDAVVQLGYLGLLLLVFEGNIDCSLFHVTFRALSRFPDDVLHMLSHMDRWPTYLVPIAKSESTAIIRCRVDGDRLAGGFIVYPPRPTRCDAVASFCCGSSIVLDQSWHDVYRSSVERFVVVQIGRCADECSYDG